MRFLLKTLVRLVCAAVLAALILPLSATLVLTVPSVQNTVVDYVCRVLSEHLESTVRIDRISVAMLNRIKVDGFYVEDLDRDTLLYARSVSARIGSITQGGSHVKILTGQVDGCYFHLRETSRNVMNIKEVVDRISRKDRKKTGRFHLMIDGLDARDVTFYLDRIKKRPHPNAVDYSDMLLSKVNLHADDFAVCGPAVMAGRTELSFVEKSGIALSAVFADLLVENGHIELNDCIIDAPDSHLNLPKVELKGDSWAEYKDYIHNVKMDVRVSDSRVSTQDASYFAPALVRWQTQMRGATVSMLGTVSDFKADISSLTLENGGSLRAHGRVRGLTDIRRTSFSINVDRLKTNSRELLGLLGRIANLHLADNLTACLHRVGGFAANGHFSGRINAFKADASVSVFSGGELKTTLEMSDSERRKLDVNLHAEHLRVGDIVSVPRIGTATFSASAELYPSPEGLELAAAGHVNNIEALSYVFRDIDLSAAMAEGIMKADLSCKDENALFDVDAIINLQDKEKPVYAAVAKFHSIDLHNLGLNKRDSVSIVSGDVDMELSGKNLDQMCGTVGVANASYINADGELNSDLLSVDISSNEDIRTISLSSDFADAVFESRCEYKDVAYYLKTFLGRYLPQLYNRSQWQDIQRTEKRMGNNMAMLSVTTKRIDPLLSCITPGIEVSEGSDFKALVDPVANRFILRAKSDFIMRNNMLATELDMNVSNRGDSLAIGVNAADLYMSGLHVRNVRVKGGAKSNVLNMAAEFTDSLSVLRGNVAAALGFSRRANMRHVSIDFKPSSVTVANRAWVIESKRIDVDSARVEIPDFRIRSQDQLLQLYGVASGLSSDEVRLNLDNFSLAPFLSVTRNMGYDIDGRGSGFVSTRGVFGECQMEASLKLDSLQVNGIGAPSLDLGSRWDFARSRAALKVVSREEGKDIITGFFDPVRMRYYADMRVDSVRMSLLDPLLKGVISGTDGYASAELTIQGKRREASLDGLVHVSGLSTTLDFTKCRYSADAVDVKVQNNKFSVDKATLRDTEGNTGNLRMNLSLNHLSNIEYDFLVDFDDMKVLSTTYKDNSLFYGDVYASGNVSVRGDKARCKIDVAAETSGRSQFFMPLSDKSNISSADFVRFEREGRRDTISYLIRKKMQFERRKRRSSAARSVLDVSLALDVKPNAEIQLVIDPTVGDIIKARGSGLLNMRVVPVSSLFEMYGDYTIQEGSYLFTLQNIINKKFVIKPGSSIQWTGEPLDAILNIEADYKVKASLQPLLEGHLAGDNISTRAVPVDCRIFLTDRLSKPGVDFGVDVPNVDASVGAAVANALSTPEKRSQQFLYLLMSSSFLSDTQANAASLGASSAANTGLELLSNQLSNWLSSENYNIVLRYRPKTETVNSDELDFGLAKGFINNRLLIEVEGNYLVDKTQVVNAKSNFSAEAYITWLLDRAGTFRLKGFTHTIDRFDENQGLQETGVGIYFREEFDNAKDFRTRIKNRFRRKRKSADKTVRAVTEKN